MSPWTLVYQSFDINLRAYTDIYIYIYILPLFNLDYALAHRHFIYCKSVMGENFRNILDGPILLRRNWLIWVQSCQVILNISRSSTDVALTGIRFICFLFPGAHTEPMFFVNTLITLTIGTLMCKYMHGNETDSLTYLPILPHLCVSDSGQHWVR